MHIKNIFKILIFVSVVTFLTGCGKTKINLNDYFDYELSGYDGHGMARGDVAHMDLKDAIIAGGSISGNESLALEVAIYDCIDGDWSRQTDLKNGEHISFDWDEKGIEKFMAMYPKVKLEYEDVLIEVKGLDDIGEFNPFDHLEVTFDGVSPKAKVMLKPDYTITEMSDIYFSPSADEVANGDTITITAEPKSGIDTFIKNFGCTLSETEKTYEVSGVSYYLSDLADLPDDMNDKMNNQLIDHFTAEFAKRDTKDKENLISIDLVGNYLLSVKEDVLFKDKNILYYVYKITISNTDTDSEEYYWYGYYTDVMFMGDGTCTVNIGDYTPASRYSSYTKSFKLPEESKFSYYGIRDIDSVFNTLVVTNVDDYTYQSNIN